MMWKRCVLVLLVVILCVPSLALSSAPPEREYLILVYLCGTDLESKGGAASTDLMEMVRAGLEEDGPVTVLVQAGGAKRWRGGLLESGESRRLLISNIPQAVGPSLGNLDMGVPSTLIDFIQFGLEEYPAKRVGLVLWDHGGGATGGVCYDELSGNSLSAGQLYAALHRVFGERDQRLAFIGFDACLMSAFEIATHLSPFADYMIASEELEPMNGWAYDLWLNELAKKPNMDPEELGRYIVDSYVESALAFDPNDYVTLSMTDLREMDGLIAAVERFGEEMSDVLVNGEFPVISRARAQMRAFGDYANASSDMVDIADVAWYCRDIAPDASRALTRAAKNAVVYSRNSANITSAAGLSILLPDKTKSRASRYLPKYDPLALMPGYTGFVQGYLEQLLNNNTFTFTPAQVQTVALSSNPAEGDLLDWLSILFSGYASMPAADWWMDENNNLTPETLTGALWGGDSTLSLDLNQQATDELGNMAHTVQLTDEDLVNLSYAEASLLQNASGLVGEEYGENVYFDLGLMKDVCVDWSSGVVYGLFDKTWPQLEGQMVPMYDQIVSDNYTRSLIPALVNDTEQYLVVVFNAANPDGLIVGYTEGYDENDNPARGYTQWEPGDEVCPVYGLLYWNELGEAQTGEYYGESIIIGTEPPAFSRDAIYPGAYYYAFRLIDVYGGSQFTDFIGLSVE